MATTKNKTKIAMPPAALNNAAMLEAINKGGSVKTPAATKEAEAEPDKLKSFTFKIYESELAQIREIQDRLPKRDRISIRDFILAAVKDRIAKEHRK